MSDLERKIAEQGPPADTDDRVFRIAWPFHPSYFGVRLISDPDELEEAIGGQTPAPTIETMKALIRDEGMRVLVLEAAPSEVRTFVRIMGQAASPAVSGQS